jgi:hypothetical protein
VVLINISINLYLLLSLLFINLDIKSLFCFQSLFLLPKNILKIDLIFLFKRTMPHRMLIAIKRPSTAFIISHAFYSPATRQISMLLSLRGSS